MNIKRIIQEVIKLPIKVGDTVYMGKFKNKKTVVKTIDWNDKGDLMINGKSALRVRIPKKAKLKEELDSWNWAEDAHPDISDELKQFLGEIYNWHYMVLIPKDEKNIIKLYIDDDSYEDELDEPFVDIIMFDDFEDFDKQQGSGGSIEELLQNSGYSDMVGNPMKGLVPVPNHVFDKISKEIPNLGWAFVDIMGM
jgi:hypothetical protein